MATHRFVIEGEKYEVEVGPRGGSAVQVTVNGTPYRVEIAGTPAAAAAPIAGAPVAATPVAAPAPVVAAPSGAAGEIRAPIPGVVLNVFVGSGQQVTVGAKLLVIEAMKMENEIVADVAGVVGAVSARPQQEVRQGDLLVTINVG